MCIKKIGVHAQNMISILDSNIQHDWGDLYDHLLITRILTLIIDKIFMSSKNHEDMTSTGICLSTHTNCVFSYPKEKWAGRKTEPFKTP